MEFNPFRWFGMHNIENDKAAHPLNCFFTGAVDIAYCLWLRDYGKA